MAGHARESDNSFRFLAHASKQHGLVALHQLRALGFSARLVQYYAATGRLHRIHRAVYSIVPRELLTRDGHWMAAVLACGPRAVLSHRTAADLLGLRRTERSRIEVTVGRRTALRHTDVQVHCSTKLTRADVTRERGIPCTSVSRTLLDLAAVVSRRALERAFDQAEIMQVLDLRALQRQLKRNPNHRGAGVVRAVLAEHYVGSTPTANELEEAFLAICRRAVVPDPQVNAWIDLGDGEPMIWADFVWREQRVIVETDGPSVHGTHQARQSDPRRDQRALLAGWKPMRAPWRQVMRRPRELEKTIARLIAPPAAPG